MSCTETDVVDRVFPLDQCDLELGERFVGTGMTSTQLYPPGDVEAADLPNPETNPFMAGIWFV